MLAKKFLGAVLLGACLLSGCKHQETSRSEEVLFSGKPFNEHIRSTEARTPEEERLGFELPEGFEIQLFASEPDIGKPLNIAFDAQGRLWVTQSYEYPFPAEPGEGSDRLSILEDTDGDGKADKFTHFEDTLNIPIGVLPVNDETFAYSIPNLYRFSDTDGDQHADHSEVVLGAFGHRDTHGMVNNLTRGYDGWVYTCHGFTNTSTIAGADGDSISMTSGNTFRFRPDGSRVEQTTFGQVNPFGLAFDEWGYLYSTDCHTSPIYQLIRGADYPHFGKKEVGIGFGPDSKPMGEESTALAGLVYYAASQFPEEYQHNFYIGDVVTCRIHRNSFEFKGSTPVAKAEEDLVKSADPWFRPVDIKMGPDGALYVADFYNSIIGHYEVPLDHPKRDKVRGRIWRITYTGAKENTENINLQEKNINQLISALDDDNLHIRMTAADQLADRFGQQAARPLAALLRNAEASARQHALALWVLHRADALSEEMLQAAATHADPQIRTHAMRIIRETADPQQKHAEIVKKALADESLHVQRAAVEALASYPGEESLALLLAQHSRIPEYDNHYRYTLRLMLRNLLRDEKIMRMVMLRQWDDKQRSAMADVMTGVENHDAGIFLYDYLAKQSGESERLPDRLQHIIRFVPGGYLSKAVTLSRQQSASDPMLEFQAFRAVQEGFVQRGGETDSYLKSWGTQLSSAILEEYMPSASDPEVNVDHVAISAEATEKLQLAVDLAARFEVASGVTQISSILQNPTAEASLRSNAARALLALDAAQYTGPISEMLMDEQESDELKRSLIGMLGEMPLAVSRPVFENTTQLNPALQRETAMALASSDGGRALLFEKVQRGEMQGRALLDPKVKERLLSNISSRQLATYEQLIERVPAIDAERDQLIETRLTAFQSADTIAASGVMVFNIHCKSCHRVTNEGGMIGPQLSGVGNWGAEALATKILDPNRNISEAFRTYTIRTRDGKVLTGLFRREEGEAMIFADMGGNEFAVAKANIAERTASRYTLMPDHFGETLEQDDFNALLTYLLEQ
jgi:putative heme-binding domain-containing protein